MYESHWGLREAPFRAFANPRFFYESPSHEEALARLHFLVDQQRRLGLLVGPGGCGKSLLLDVFATQLRRKGYPTAKISLVGVDVHEFLSLLAGSFDLFLAAGVSQTVLWRAITDRLAEYRYQQVETAILLDDADQAAPTVLEQVVRLSQHDSASEGRLTLVLAGRQDKLERLGIRLLELAELRIDLGPWNEADTADFVRVSLAEAGRAEPIFAPPALTRLHELSAGNPRRVSQLADLALLVGAGQELAEIDATVIDGVYHELGVVRV